METRRKIMSGKIKKISVFLGMMFCSLALANAFGGTVTSSPGEAASSGSNNTPVMTASSDSNNTPVMTASTVARVARQELYEYLMGLGPEVLANALMVQVDQGRLTEEGLKELIEGIVNPPEVVVEDIGDENEDEEATNVQEKIEVEDEEATQEKISEVAVVKEDNLCVQPAARYGRRVLGFLGLGSSGNK